MRANRARIFQVILLSAQLSPVTTGLGLWIPARRRALVSDAMTARHCAGRRRGYLSQAGYNNERHLN
jgi:hypothetical protein